MRFIISTGSYSVPSLASDHHKAEEEALFLLSNNGLFDAGGHFAGHGNVCPGRKGCQAVVMVGEVFGHYRKTLLLYCLLLVSTYIKPGSTEQYHDHSTLLQTTYEKR